MRAPQVLRCFCALIETTAHIVKSGNSSDPGWITLVTTAPDIPPGCPSIRGLMTVDRPRLARKLRRTEICSAVPRRLAGHVKGRRSRPLIALLMKDVPVGLERCVIVAR